jgi:release factor glutamine methyltransferase
LSLLSQTPLYFARDALHLAALRLREAGVESAALDARLLLEYVLQVSREELLFSLDLAMTSVQYNRLEGLIAERVKRKPIAQIIEKREFWGLDFVVSGATLDPRPDSETLIEAVLARVENRNSALKLLDLGTGTGCLLLSLLSELPVARGVGVDISKDALEIARQNAKKLGLFARANFIRSDWGNDLVENGAEKYDIIVSNPPYIPSNEIAALAPEVAEFEPKLALDGGISGLDCYRVIIRELPNLLVNSGFAVLEIGMGQESEIEKIAAENGLKMVGVYNDLAGIIRCLMFVK